MEPRYFRFICIHDQCPAVIKELSYGLGELGFPLLLCSPADEGQLQGVFVIEPKHQDKENKIKHQTDWKTEELWGSGTRLMKYQTAEEGIKGEGKEQADKRGGPVRADTWKCPPKCTTLYANFKNQFKNKQELQQ